MQEVEKLVQQFRTKSNREALKIHSLKTIHCTPYQIKTNNLFLWAGPRKILPSSKYLNMFISRSFEHFAAFCFFGEFSTAASVALLFRFTVQSTCRHVMSVHIQSYDPKTVTLTAQSLVGAKEPSPIFFFLRKNAVECESILKR